MFDYMDWSHATTDEIDRGFDHFGGLHAASTAELCSLIQAADLSQTWMRDDARTLSEWVSVRLQVRSETASRLVRIARRLIDLSVVSERFCSGDLSLDQVDALSRVATPETEQDLVEEALGLNNAQLDRMARRASSPCAEDIEQARRGKTLWIQRRLGDAGGRLTTDLPNAELEIVETAIREKADRLPVNPETGVFDSYSQRLADGLVEVCVTTGDDTKSSPPQVTLFAELDVLITETEGVAELFSGNLVANDTAKWLACDCVVETVVTDGSVVAVSDATHERFRDGCVGRSITAMGANADSMVVTTPTGCRFTTSSPGARVTKPISTI